LPRLLSEEVDDFADLYRDFEQVQGRLRWLIIVVARS
jgi:hypothetical protein